MLNDEATPASHSDDGGSISVRDMLRMLQRHWRLGASVFILCVASVAVYCRYSQVLYRATSSVLVETVSKNILAAEEKSATITQDVTKVQKTLAESRPVILRTLAASGLSPEECKKITGGGTDLPGNFAAHIDGQLLCLEVLDPSAKQAVLLANAWAQAFVDEMAKRSKDPSILARDFLEKSLPQYRADWIKKQEALNKFELETRFDPTEFDKHPLRKRVEELSIKLNTLNMELAGLEAEQDVVTRPNVGTDDLIRLTRARTDPVLMGILKQLDERKSRQLDALEKFKSGSQDLRSIDENIDTIKAELKKAAAVILVQIKFDLERSKAERQKIQPLFDVADKEFEVLKTNAARHRVLSSEATMAERLYSELAQKKSVSDLTGRYDFSYATQWEQAELREFPYKPRWLLNLAVGCMLGGTLAVFAMYLAEALDNTIRNGRDLEQHLRLPVAASIPRSKKVKNLADVFTLTGNQSGSAAVNALRNVLIGIELNRDSNEPLLLTITSPSAKDGKTFVASTLAALFAAQGRRTLLVDAALHAGSLSTALKYDTAPGLFDLLDGTAWSPTFSNVVAPGLFFLSAGTRPAATQSHVNPDRVRAVAERLKREYDVIIFDAPAVLCFAEAAVFAQCSDATLLLARSGKTIHAQMERAMAMLNSARARGIQCLVNDVKSRNAGEEAAGAYGFSAPVAAIRPPATKSQAARETNAMLRRVGVHAAASEPV